jgi:hypothetical protein
MTVVLSSQLLVAFRVRAVESRFPLITTRIYPDGSRFQIAASINPYMRQRTIKSVPAAGGLVGLGGWNAKFFLKLVTVPKASKLRM